MKRLDLEGQRAVVTGAAAGLGLAIAKQLAVSGARVALWDRDAAGLARAAATIGLAAETVVVDVCNGDAIAVGLAETLERLGAVDVLVNNAGISGPNRTMSEYPAEEWRRVLDINATAAFLCCRTVVPHMVAAGYGRIVNIASFTGKEGNPNAPASSESKAAVIALTKSLGRKLACAGVVVNCVTSAAVWPAIFDKMSQEHVQYMLSKMQMGRVGRVEEVAALVRWLCTYECSFSTGVVFDLSRGQTTYQAL